jgi:GR25 family glycosyltransferase involved in LPS biosynthesis
MSETVEQFKTGLRCHTLGDYILGIRMALEGKFDREYIRDRAVQTYDMFKLAHNYEYAIKSVLDIYAYEKQEKGWYSKASFLQPLVDLNVSNSLTKEGQLNCQPDIPLQIKAQINIDMVYYINLKRRKDRNDHILDQLKNAGIDDSQITRYCAIDGMSYEFSEGEEVLFAHSSYRSTPSFKKIAGNQLSHFNIYKDMLRKGYKKILILQDDAILAEDFITRFNLVSSHCPENSEIINLGLHKYAVYNKFEAYDLGGDCDSLHVEETKINEYVCHWKHNLNPCSLSYILTDIGAKHLVHYFTEKGFLRETDHCINDYLKQKNIFYGSRKILATGALLGTDIFDTPKWWK